MGTTPSKETRIPGEKLLIDLPSSHSTRSASGASGDGGGGTLAPTLAFQTSQSKPAAVRNAWGNAAIPAPRPPAFQPKGNVLVRSRPKACAPRIDWVVLSAQWWLLLPACRTGAAMQQFGSTMGKEEGGNGGRPGG